MPPTKRPSAFRALLTLFGLAVSGAAIFAVQLRLDNNSSWGPSRKLLLGVGLALAAASWIPGWARWAWKQARNSNRLRVIGEAMGAARNKVARQPALQKLGAGLAGVGRAMVDGVHRIPIARNLVATPLRTASTASFLIWVLAVAAYAWIGSVGTWTNWPPTTSDFDLLAQGFVRGQLNLPVLTPPELLAMPDPYVMTSRQYLPNLWDVSYYKGEFFLYWGPVPSLILTAAKGLAPVHVDDGLLTLAYVAGMGLMIMLCLLALWRRWPADLPWWAVLPPLFCVLGATPVVWLLSRGAVYEVAIASGQFFLLAGLLATLPAVWGEPLTARRLAAASTLLALAVGCRLNLAPACLLILGVGWGLSLRAKPTRRARKIAQTAAAGLPMLSAAVLFGAYNQARFGSWMEFGHRFQLGRWDMYHQYSRVFGLQNAIPNLYNYFLNGVHWLNVFPYLKPAWGQYYIWLTHSYAPDGYHTEKVAGVLVGIPFLWLAGLAVVNWARAWGGSVGKPGGWAKWGGFLNGVRGVETYLMAIAVLLIAPLVSFVAISMRHEVDFVPTLGLLAATGFWGGLDRLKGRPVARGMLIGLVFLLAGVTVLVGLLLAMTGFQGNFETYNPELFHRLTALFSP